MHQQRSLLSNLRRVEQDAIKLVRALLAQAERRRFAMQAILERGDGRRGQVAISRLVAVLIIAGFDIELPDEPGVSQDERSLLDVLCRAQLQLTKSAMVEGEHDVGGYLSDILRDELEACARALAEIGIYLPTNNEQ